MKKTLLGALVALPFLLHASLLVAASPKPSLPGTARATATPAGLAARMSPKERGDLARQYVLKWGGYAQRVYGTPVGIWAQRMVRNFTSADPKNLRDALQRDTFEGAQAELLGYGSRMSDADVINALAKQTVTGKQVSMKLGDTARDLVFTPLAPCRIVDTRVAGGSITANTSRDFVAIAQSGNFTAQGGSSTDCGTAAAGASAVALNVTAILPLTAGYATVYPYGTTAPVASSINYGSGAVVSNFVTSKIPNPVATKDFSLYTYATSDFVVDIVGYYAPPQATALECVWTNGFNATTIASNGGTAVVIAPTCPTGYTATFNSCSSDSFQDVSLTLVGLDGCAARNDGAVPRSVTSRSTCCRIPGR
jgi:hypothetical protein